MALGAGAAGLGTGIGTLFATLGRQKLRGAEWALKADDIRGRNALRDSQIGEADSKTALNRDQLAGLTEIGQRLIDAGYTEPQAGLGSAFARANGGTNLQNATNAWLTAQIPVAGSAAVPQLGDKFQQALGRDTMKVADGVQYAPFGDAGQQTTPTLPGQALMAARKAQATASYAQAAAQHAHARLYDTQTAAGGWNPKEGAGGEKWVTPATLPQDYMNLFTAPPALDKDGKPDASGIGGNTFDPAAFRTFQGWAAARAQTDPRFNDQRYAYGQYVLQRPIGSGLTPDSPADRGAVLPGDVDDDGDMALLGDAVAGSAPAPARPSREKLYGSHSPITIPAGPDAPAPAQRKPATAGEPARPATQAEFAALPAGALFVNPADGQIMRKKK